ncbi:hypothetical protein KA075_01505 [Candidatus Saccharibacteria bacterium]|nr:hypothetical protein [Candidatus Saccharibacteria bacterium]
MQLWQEAQVPSQDVDPPFIPWEGGSRNGSVAKYSSGDLAESKCPDTGIPAASPRLETVELTAGILSSPIRSAWLSTPSFV